MRRLRPEQVRGGPVNRREDPDGPTGRIFDNRQRAGLHRAPHARRHGFVVQRPCRFDYPPAVLHSSTPYSLQPPVSSRSPQRPLLRDRVFDSARPTRPPAFLSKFTDRRYFQIGWNPRKRRFYTTAFSTTGPAFDKRTSTRRSPSAPAVSACPRPAVKSLKRSPFLSIICEICAICGPFLSLNVRFSATAVFDSARPGDPPAFLSKFTDRRYFRIGWSHRKRGFYTTALAPPKTRVCHPARSPRPPAFPVAAQPTARSRTAFLSHLQPPAPASRPACLRQRHFACSARAQGPITHSDGHQWKRPTRSARHKYRRPATANDHLRKSTRP